MIAVGLMSGTSLDGVDAALVRIRPQRERYSVELLGFESRFFDRGLYDALLSVLPPNSGTVAAVAHLHKVLGDVYAGAAHRVAGAERVDYVASHGQTVWHDGAAHVTLQLGDAFVIRERVRATVCYDFRSADCAAHGHGAPLIARIDALLLASATEDRVALNLGGIANVTLLRAGAPPEEVVAFDTGPANMLLDAFMCDRSGGARTLDKDGALAARGRVDEKLLAAMLDDEYFAALPPKTTGRERFGMQFLEEHRQAFEQLSIEDGAATLAELTAASIAQAILQCGFDGAHVIVSGGGAHNRTLLARLAARLEPGHVETSEAFGIPVDAKEAIGFAVLGYETLRGRAANTPAATGAVHPVVLGAIAPHNLCELLARVERECGEAA